MTTSPVRLRRLEVQGFKSFATRTSFEFGPGITAIVGPNGSGKSNLADALRWVLGEQNPRVLRLRRLEDVIFAGGGKRAQSGFAEVSLVLDNVEGWLPLDFAEVAVTRRLHRSGESEYLINRKRVRLRDIHELFLKARLGQNSYAILGQGMVDTVLSLRPEERRSLIEEAADVRRHRLKIDEANDQLAATRDNRDRVELLVAEIAPRLAQLERQARRASEQANLSRDLAESLRTMFRGRLRVANLDMDNATKDADQGARQFERAQANFTELEHTISQVEAEQHAAIAERDRVEVAWRTLNDRHLQTERALVDRVERLPVLQERRRELENDLLSLQREAMELAAQESPTANAQESLRTADEAVVDAEVTAGRVNEDLIQAQGVLAESEQKLRKAQSGDTQAEDRLARIEEEQRGMEEESTRLRERRQGALARVKTWAAKFRAALARATQLNAQATGGQDAVAEAERRARNSANALLQGQGALSELSDRIDTHIRRRELLENEQEARRPTEEVIVALLDALRGGGPGRPRVLGILGGMIHVQRGMEVAIEAALAEGLNTLIVQTEREALAAISVLQQIEAGRLSFFILEGQRGAHGLNIANDNGVLGVASRFVRCDDTYRDLVDSLLGRVVVVEDLETARRIVRRGLGSAVTLDGTLIRPGGTASGGRGKADGYVFRASLELDDITQEIARLQEEHATEEARVKRLREQSIEYHGRLQELEESHTARLRLIAEAERQVAQLRRSLEPLRGELEWMRTSLVRTADRQAAARAEDRALRARLNTAGAPALVQLAEDSTLARQRVTELVEQQTVLNARLAESRGRRAALVSEQGALEMIQRSREAASERVERLISARRDAIARGREEEDRVQAEAERLTSELEASRAEAWKSRQELDLALAAVTELAVRLREMASTLAGARSMSAMQERARFETELALRRHQEALDHLRAEMLTEGLDADADIVSQVEDPLVAGPSIAELETKIRGLRRRIREIGGVNDDAETDFLDSKQRYDFLTTQLTDLRDAESALMEALEHLRQIVREQFRSAFQAINLDFQLYFRTFFGGGQAKLVLAEPEDYGESGVDIIAQPPGKRLQNLAMLSGGERSMTAVALLFALLESNPAPFCVLDEVDAALDESNVGRFGEALARLADRSQFLVITHNRGTVQAADQIYGVSMAGDGISNVLSMRLSEAAPLLA